MAPVVKIFKEDTINFNTKVCVTAQHRDLLDQVLDFFSIIPDYDLDLMSPNQNLFNLTASILKSIKEVLEEFNPDYVFIHGDTTTSMAVALGAFYAGAKVCHVEAGLRTFNKLSPFPEELNRQLSSKIADIHFAPTKLAVNNLLKEGIDKESIVLTGNTVIDALKIGGEIIKTKKFDSINRIIRIIGSANKFILVTGHRRENHGEGFRNIILALKTIALQNPEVLIVFPVHPNPNVKIPIENELGNIQNIKLINPQPYEAFIWLMKNCDLIITDSGGIQEEATGLGKYTLVMRDTTERPEAVASGIVTMVGTNSEKIITATNNQLNKTINVEETNFISPYGDGKASSIIYNSMINL
ncbi:UDP-N-acetylglucosamine 2-epimerase (non-hydrolyzing) [Aureibaculum marinum]|uniref:UDP-N-acetylglucosamine 2-epimerase (non-hydrolyzing) n=2 Tax=Aureibaculum marinum TaxID=2487930 RepID=A0A3N4N5Z0_9FLAO|nr:UDP-N-acetylglucosamine 2-epimerase (non-hydrolyzing) [Aureibaculum marinum]